ncbi:uncharacterized protein M421DRAFT_2527 [Didymella exigua CBS 183.55]|uniref:Uncharacterized protein n=1 Tax=Didymella exigua CBS 183.55 TaxID=1150837 RepID=A0A6A5RWH2_9PLEO|nr:uncharacterized protein M421DRAFT_2527 [Didymella exigua CBS 183.55]KAF1931909.1 hypothetical protein M421DRAFT_2527 [Didymella exigua CBS 183.55]
MKLRGATNGSARRPPSRNSTHSWASRCLQSGPPLVLAAAVQPRLGGVKHSIKANKQVNAVRDRREERQTSLHPCAYAEPRQQDAVDSIPSSPAANIHQRGSSAAGGTAH